MAHLKNKILSSSTLTVQQSSSNTDFSFISNDWFAYDDCQILLPENKVPKSIIHFVGGFLVGNYDSIKPDFFWIY